MARFEPLLETKLYPPQTRAGWVQRDRLITRLNSGVEGKVSVISAPAGYGKTTLLGSWISSADHPVAWLSLDESDNRIEVFLTYLVAALQKILPGIGDEVLAALEQSQSPQAEILLTLLINDIHSRAKPAFIVFDDCQLISNQEIFEALDYLIKYKPSDFHIILAGRVDPMISLSKFRVDGQLLEIRSSDLKFTLEETDFFLNSCQQLELPLADVEVLLRSTEGWIAGLQLAALSLKKIDQKHEFIHSFSGVHHHLIDYLVDEVLALQTPEIKSFLCRTSILDRFNAPLCDATLGIDNSRDIIHELEETNMFLIAMDSERIWFRYHHLFGSFLNLCLKDDDAGSIPDLHKNAARWLMKNNFDAEAYHHLLLSEDFELAARFAERRALHMLEMSEFTDLISWVDALPQEIVADNPRLGIYHTWALRLSARPYDLVETKLNSIEQVLDQWDLEAGVETHTAQKREELRNLRAHLLAIRAFQGIYRQDPPAALELAGKAMALHPDEEYTLSGINFVLGWGYRLSGDLISAHSAFSKSSRLSIRSGNTFMAVSTLTRAAHGLVLEGKLQAGESELMKARQISAAGQDSINPVAGFPLVYLAGINLEWRQLQDARNQAFEGIQLVERVGQIFDQVVGYSILSRIFLAEGDLDSAADACLSSRELAVLMKDYLYARRWAEDCQVRLWAAQGDAAALEKWVATCGIDPAGEPDFTRDVDHLILARALVELSQLAQSADYLEKANSLLDKLEHIVQQASWGGKLIEILLLKARCLQFAGKHSQAIRMLQKALILGEGENYLQSFVCEGRQIKNLLVENHFENDAYAQEILACFADTLSAPVPAATKSLVEPLSSREMDVMQFLATELSGPEIAGEMNIALSTLRFHTRNIYGKLQVNNRRSAVRVAEQLHLV